MRTQTGRRGQGKPVGAKRVEGLGKSVEARVRQDARRDVAEQMSGTCGCGGAWIAGTFVHADRCNRPKPGTCGRCSGGANAPEDWCEDPLHASPDPLPLAAILRRAVDHARTTDPERFPSDAAVARACWPDAAPGSARVMLAKACAPGRETGPTVARAILRACGWSVTAGPVSP